MAKTDRRDEEEEGEKQEAAAKKSGKKLLIIIIAALLVLVLGAVGAFFALKKSGAGGEEGLEVAADEEGEEAGTEGAELPGAIFPLETFIVNLTVKGSFLKTAVQLEFARPELPPNIENDVPKIRDVIIRILSSKNATEILSVEGKDKLREEVKNAVNEALRSQDVVYVYFTEFIVQ